MLTESPVTALPLHPVTESPSRPEAAVWPSPHHAVTVIRPAGGWKVADFQELWSYRGLVFNFIWRDIKVRYKHTALGIGWAVVQPLMMMLVFTSYFSALHQAGAHSVPYPLYVYAGVASWFFFSAATVAASGSIVHSEHLITKIYFPRMVATVASVGVYVVDFVIAFGLLLGLILFYHVRGVPNAGVSVTVVLVPIVLALFGFAALSVGILLAALNVTYRDFRLVIPFALQMWFFMTPVIFLEPPPPPPRPEVSEIPGRAGAPAGRVYTESIHQDVAHAQNRHDLLLYANPLCSLIMTFRATVLGGTVPWGPLGVALAEFVVIFVVGSLYFHRVEDRFADII
jgi:lipopolysaccharide transport system permease protein